mgnify:CR=1 FL=1
MLSKKLYQISLLFICILSPFISNAQVVGDIASLHSVLEQLYDELLPLCSRLIGVGRSIAGFAATWYIASRIWRHISNAEPVDFYPLLRPFAIGLCIMFFPSVLGIINGVMKPTVTATTSMVEHSNKSIAILLEKKEQAIKDTDAWQMYVGETGLGNRDRWYRYTHDSEPSGEGIWEGIGNDIKFAMASASYNFRSSIKEWLSEVLQILFQASSLCIDTLRTFQLIVLAILGPLVFGIAVFDGFGHTLSVWIARYLNVYLWLPVANIFGSIIGKVQEKMLEIDISQVENYGDTFFSNTDAAYLIFLIIGIIGYFTVPSVSNYIIHAGGGNALNYKVTNLFKSTAKSVITSTSGSGMIRDVMGDKHGSIVQSMASHGTSSPYFNGNSDKDSNYKKDKIRGSS